MFARCCLWFAVLLATAFASTAAMANAKFQPGRGISMDLWVTWPSPESWGDRQVFSSYPEWISFVSDEEIQSLRKAGLDTIRLPIEPAFILFNNDPERLRTIAAGIKIAIDRLLAENFNVIVDLHTIPRDQAMIAGAEQIVKQPETFAAYVGMVEFVTTQIRHYAPDRLAIEVLNEPMLDCHDSNLQRRWQSMANELYRAVVNASPERTVILSGTCWGSAEGLSVMDPAPFGSNVIWSFHSYEPFAITHQGAGWTGDLTAHLRNIPYPPYRDGARALSETIVSNVAAIRRHARPNNKDAAIDMLTGNLNSADTPEKLKASLREPFETAARWADAHNIPRSQIFLGEFGMIGREYGSDLAVPDQWRLAYMQDMISLAEDYGFGWSVWSFGGAFGLMQAYGGEALSNTLLDDMAIAPLN